MQLKTILNRVQKFKSFVYGDVREITRTVGDMGQLDGGTGMNSKTMG